MKKTVSKLMKLALPAAGVAAVSVASMASMTNSQGLAKVDNVAIMKAALEASVTATSEMQSAAEWHESKLSPPNLFAMLNEKRPVTPAELCAAFSQIPTESKAYFSNEISEYKELVAPCYSDLKAQLDQYWGMQAEFTAMMNPTMVASENVDLHSRDVQMDNQDGVRYPTPHQGLRSGEFALTFDDGPLGENTEKVLDTLKRYNAKSTFFLVGRRVTAQGSDKIIKRIAAEGHSIGNHSYTHSGMKHMLRDKGAAAVTWEFQTTQKAIFKILGWVDPFMRFPGGTDNDALLALTRSWKMAVFHWNLDAKDFDTPNPNEVVRKTIALMDKYKGGIFLMHDIQPQTVIALPHILEWMASKGYKTVTLVPEKMADRTHQPLLNN